MSEPIETKLFSMQRPANTGPLRPGQTVSLNGGGHIMTIRKAVKAKGETTITVDWLNDAGDLQSADFPACMLKPADPESEPEPEAASE